jgi:diguanylate cyclase (GGDEF)-like protein
VTVLGIDLDNFKAVNDCFGHFRGDTVLREAAEIFGRQLRDYDVVVRNGGDEFVVVLPGTTSAGASSIVERIRQEFDSYTHSALGACASPVGVSIGVATFPDEAPDLQSLLALSDAAMYRDKRSHKEERRAA